MLTIRARTMMRAVLANSKKESSTFNKKSIDASPPWIT